MFQQLQSEVTDRFAAAKSFFQASKGFKGDHAAAAKGMAFVQIYAIYEYAVEAMVMQSILAIAANGHAPKDLKPSLLALILNSELQSLQNRSGKDQWGLRLAMLERAFSSQRITKINPCMPKDGDNYKYSHLQMIFRVFGIYRLPVRRRIHEYIINEIVDHRNAIGHGRDIPENIGRRYTRSEVMHRLVLMRGVCLLLIEIMQSYCSKPDRQCKKH